MREIGGHLVKQSDREGVDQSLLLKLMASSQFLNTLPAGVLLQGADGSVMGFNDDAVEILGTTRKELTSRRLGDPRWDTVREDYSPFPFDELPVVVTQRTGRPCSGVVMGTENWRQARRWIFTNTAPVDLGNGDTGVLSTFIDITPRIQSRRMLQLLTEVNHVVMFATDEDECLEQLCRVLVEKGHYALAWIGAIAADGSGGVDVLHAHGCTEYLFDGMVSWWGSRDSGQGPTGLAIRSGASQVINDLTRDAKFKPWRARATEYRLGSSAAIPLLLGGRTAVVNIYDRNLFSFDQTAVTSLENIMREVEYGLEHVRNTRRTEAALAEVTRTNNALRVAEQSLDESSQWFKTLVANSSDLMIVHDPQATLLYANPAAEKLFGYEAGTQLGRDLFEIVHPDDRVTAAELAGSVIRDGGVSEPTVLRFQTSSGEYRYVEAVLTNALDVPAIRGIVGNGRDVTEQTYLTRALQTLTRANQVLMHATDEASLIADICNTIVSSGGYLLAWVGYRVEDEEQTIRPVASAGHVEMLVDSKFSWGDNEFARGPTGLAVRTGEVQVVRDTRDAPNLAPWKAMTEDYSIRTGCVFPLKISDGSVASLTIYSEDLHSFAEAELELLSELADDIAFGIGRLRDAERLARNEALLRQTEQSFRLAFEHNTAPMVFSDLEDRVIAVNPAFCRMTGYSREELMGKDSKQFTYPEDVGITEETLQRLNADEVEEVRYIKRYLRKDGRVIVSEVSRSPARDENGKTLYYVASERDITEERALAAQLQHQALHDPLTGLANRALFEDRLNQAHARVQRQGGLCAVLLVDLDDFKGVNDTYGHVVGDQLLQGIAHRFQSVTRSTDSLSRFGGDEFLYLAEGLSAAEEAEEVAARLLAVLAEPFAIEGLSFEQRASVGMVIWDARVQDPSELIQNADVALYEAKRDGKSKYVVFTQSMHQEAVSQFTMVQDLRRAMQSGEVSMHYQPIVDLTTTEVVGFEALMRWEHPERGWIAPNSFIPLAEQSELIIELGSFAIHQAVAAASTWEESSPGTFAPYVTVNLSAHQFQDPNLAATIEDALRTSRLDPERLVVEITESVTLVDTTESLNIIDRLTHLGVNIALDDFGTGYSSLSYLVRLRPKIIKIDRYFVSPSYPSAHSDALLEAIVSLGQKLGIVMVAEGIETAAQLDRLRALHCELGQGYFFSPAVTVAEASTMVGHTFAN
jgi:diguanylate cyclase (GGDEF)-like protein/PAS domain S-box-containing protein